jgi:hypothetical protein
LIDHAQAVRNWSPVASACECACECATIDLCGLFVDPRLAPPADEINLTIHRSGVSRSRHSE